jgi:putative toxin-antitoxin system antitoxin component (TIGR02293 family)
MPTKTTRAKTKRTTRGRGAQAAAQGEGLRRLLPLSSLYTRDAMERVRLVKAGVPAQLLVVLAQDMAISKEKLYATIGVARATADRKIRQQTLLSADESERALGIARLVGQVDQIVRESGTAEGFAPARWTAAWLDRPHPALGGARPATLMDTAEGRGIVSDLVAQMQSGAYA